MKTAAARPACPRVAPAAHNEAMSAGRRFLLVAPAVTAFVWLLLRRGVDVDAWSLHDGSSAADR